MFKKKELSVNFIFVLLLAGCSAKVSDFDIVVQVTNYLKNDERMGFMGTTAFSKFFEVANVSVKDKLIKDKEMTVICNVTVRIIMDYQGASGVTIAYGFIVGNGPGTAGLLKSSDLKFMFEKYESGWRIKGFTQ